MDNKAFFLPYQQHWINDESRLKFAEKSRRVGFTYASSYRHNRKMLEKPAGFTQWVSSRDLLTAKEYVTDYLAKWARASNVVAQGLAGDDVRVIDEAKGITAFVVQYETGNRVVSLSSTPEAFAGKGGDVYLDEVDLHDDSGKLIDMAMPCILWGNQLEAVSAYRVDGSTNTPWAIMIADARGDNPQGASLHRVSLDDAIDQGLVEKINETKGSSMTREQFRSECEALCRTKAAFESQFGLIVSDANGSLLTYEQIRGCEDAELNSAIGHYPMSRELFQGGPLFLGMDIGRTRDLSVIWLLEELSGQLVTRSVYTMANTRFREQQNTLNHFLGLPRLRRGHLDKNGIGAMLAEGAEEDHPDRAFGIDLTRASEVEMGTRLQESFNDRTTLIPALAEIREDLHTPQKSSTATGLQSVAAARSKIGHADRFWSLALAKGAAMSQDDYCYFAPVSFNLNQRYAREVAI